MITELGLPTNILGPTIAPGTEIGKLRAKLADETGLPAELRVVATASHDTASAVAAVPATGDSKWCYISSGTWSLLGAELDKPCVTPAAQAASYTNELGVAGTFRFLKNIAGLWLVQECRRDFARRGQDLDYAKLTQLAAECDGHCTLVDPAHTSFQTPGDMPEKIAEFARASGQIVPTSPGEFIRCCLESLALSYREKLNTLESMLDEHFDTIHIVGGGGKNTLLSQMTADATGRRVIVGPYEATAMGNLLVQAMATGHVRDLPHLRQIVANSSGLITYERSSTSKWDAAASRFEKLCK
jgi:rhamnulokinase